MNVIGHDDVLAYLPVGCIAPGMLEDVMDLLIAKLVAPDLGISGYKDDRTLVIKVRKM